MITLFHAQHAVIKKPAAQGIHPIMTVQLIFQN